MERLLVEALKAGLGVLEFWALTPRETTMAIEAAQWRMDLAHRARMSLAWHTAALTRVKKLPPLARLIEPPAAKSLTPEERTVRQGEFAEMSERFGRVKVKHGRR